ncbi:MAG: alpha/beta hydrolase [Halieaceae bacterium]|jgi:esterase FrsA|nr:alpha/beta hydrolase [Halieaceae bacterium]
MSSNHFFLQFALVLLIGGLWQPLVHAQVINDAGELVIAGGRNQSLGRNLGNQAIVDETSARISTIHGDGPGVWAYEWRLLGEIYEKRGDKLATAGKTAEALETYNQAMDIYNHGYLPDNYTAAERKSFYRFRDLKLKMNQYLETPFEIVKIPFEGHEIIVHLYSPKGVSKPPLVLYTGGVDGSKERTEPMSQVLAATGIAMAAFDLAGTGESMDWFARPDSHKLHMRIFDYFIETGAYDAERLGLWGGSFGGYYAIRMAADDKRLKAVVNYCGLVHSAFQVPPEAMQAALKSRTGALLRSSLRRMGFDPDNLDVDEFDKFYKAQPFSLIDAGVVGTGKKTIHTPMLIINGGRDDVVSLEDMKLVEAAASNGEMWILGTDPHCAPRYKKIAIPQATAWLVDQLMGQDPTP